MRAARDSAQRADAIGVDVRTHRWLGFTLAGAAAGLAGGLYAFSKGSIDPTLLSIPQSVDFLAMNLLGGIQAVSGAIVGAGAFHVIKDIVLLDQPSVSDSKKTVKALLDEAGVTVTRFVRFEVGQA